MWLWQVRWLPRLSFPSCRAEASFTSTARRRACSRLLLLGTAREAPRCCAETFPALPMGLCPVPQGLKGLTPLTRVSGSFGMWLCLPGQPGFDVISFFPAPSFHLFTWFFAFSRRVSGGSSQPHNRQLCSPYPCACLTLPPQEICLEDKHELAEIL